MGRPRNARKCWTRVDALETCKANGSHFDPRLMIGGKSKSQPLVCSDWTTEILANVRLR